MVPPGKQLAEVDAGVDDAGGAASNSRGRGSGRGRGLVEEDHQTLNNQVNQYFEHIKQYAGGANGDDDEEEEEDEEEDVEDEELDGDDDEEEDEDDDRYVHNNGVEVDVDFGVDLELNIDRAISESLANYNSAQMRDHNLGSGVSVGVNLDPVKEHKGIMVNRQLGESARGVNNASSSSSAVNTPVNSGATLSGKAGGAGGGSGTGTGTGAGGSVSMDPLRNVVDHMGPIGHMADHIGPIGPIGTIGHIADHMADHMDNMEMDLDNMQDLGDHHEDNEVKLEEADLAAVAAAAAAAAVKENGGFHSVGGDR
ncbi:hypothetical protein PMKS-000224 [Pichia membranifaciens]|uniref:Uncharacterized protein n=1 Tax=Pichia membranifaciens TaxID=4926 RepID=A0A1Q2YBA4_9ASCO|nr:hypothetical protein PMKS-000224 [Pichia membranifaciens]